MNFTPIRSWGEFANKVYRVFRVPSSSTPDPSSYFDPDSSSSDQLLTAEDFERTSRSGSGGRGEIGDNYILGGGGEIVGSGGGGKWDWDLNRVTRRINRSFFTSWYGPPPIASFYLIHLILAIGLVVALSWLVGILFYHTMQKLRSLCPSFKFLKRSKRRRDEEDPSFSRNKDLNTPEMLEQRRQERLDILQKECENLENQLFSEKTTTLTSRASDSDLEYLGYGEDSPPLKRNSISLQDIPVSVMRIRREKQLRQLKEEVDNLHALSQGQDLDKEPLRSPLLRDLKFDYFTSKSSSSKSESPSPVDTGVGGGEPLSQRISHLRAQRKLQEIRTDLESLALHLVHAEEIKAKTASLQDLDLPHTSLSARRQERLFSIAKEIENVKTYRLQKKSILATVFPDQDKERQTLDKVEILAKLNSESFSEKNKSPSKSPLLRRQESQSSELSQDEGGSTSASGSHSRLLSAASLKRMRAQELNRVRVELKELSYKLNLNYVFDDDGDREKMMTFPSDWPKQTSSFSRENSFGK